MQKSPAENSRPPVVVIMGHVDHGKTTLLDYIRRTNVAAKESGGITQHIGAYEITHKGRTITFIDTPGHEAFSKMRSRGARVADVAILVVASDEGVKPQTKEAIEHIKEAELPFVVALNKIDRPGADPNRVRQELATAGVMVEAWGGEVPDVPISAKTGEGIDALLDIVLLLADIRGLRADPAKPAEGVVIESEFDRRRGPVATVLILDGTLHVGDTIAAGEAFGKVRRLEDFLGKEKETLSFSSPARVIGWEKLPEVGEKFVSGIEPGELRNIVSRAKTIPAAGGDMKLIIKADAAGSLEALEHSIRAIPHDELEVVIVDTGVGDISESDVKLASAANAWILGFRIKVSPEATAFLKQNSVRILEGDVIYELIEAVAKEINERLELKRKAAIKPRLQVLAKFSQKGDKQIIGGKVVEGMLEKGMRLDVIRAGQKLGTGKIVNLQHQKADVPRVESGAECGILFESQLPIMVGDILEAVSQS